jgi:hypothetical protein
LDFGQCACSGVVALLSFSDGSWVEGSTCTRNGGDSWVGPGCAGGRGDDSGSWGGCGSGPGGSDDSIVVTSIGITSVSVHSVTESEALAHVSTRPIKIRKVSLPDRHWESWHCRQ